MLKIPESATSNRTRPFDKPIYVIREMGKNGGNYSKHDTREMGSLLSLHIAFDAKCEDKVEVGGMGRLTYVFDGDNVRQRCAGT